MDNILKLLLGVLSVAGLIAMVTPTNLAVDPESAQPPAAIEAPVLNGNGGEILTEKQLDGEESAEDDSNVFAIGVPTIDGKPIGATNDQQQPQPQIESPMPFDAANPGANFAYNPSAIESYAPPVIYSPQPVPGTFVPANAGE